MYLYDADLPRRPMPCSMPPFDLAGPFGQSGSLRRFSPEELIFSPDETVAILQFFWPEMDMSRLGRVTDQEREFAQGLLLEAVDASCTIGIMESIYRRFFMKVPTSFKNIFRSAMKIVRHGVHQLWFKRCRELSAEQVKVYESIRRTLARNFHSVMRLRLETGELTY